MLDIAIPVSFAIAALLIFLGWRGKRIGDHPVCRKCGFDLSGKPSTTIFCGECGSDLGEFDAVEYGHFRRNKGFLVTAAILIIFFGGLGVSTMGTIKTLRYAPFRWVVWRACSSDPDLRLAALAEVNRRAGRGKLSDADWAELATAAAAYRMDASKPWADEWGDLVKDARVNHHLREELWKNYLQALGHHAFLGGRLHTSSAFDELRHRSLDDLLTPGEMNAVLDELLARQADATSDWDPAWGDWVQDCRTAGSVDDKRWARFITQSWNSAVSLRLRQRVRRGDPLPFEVDLRITRAASLSDLSIRFSNIHLRWAGRTDATREISAESDLSFFSGSGTTRGLLPAGDFPAGIRDGAQQVSLTATITAAPKDRNPVTPLVSSDINLPGTFVLQPSTEPSVRLIHQSAGMRAVPALRLSENGSTVACTLTCSYQQFDAAFDIFLSSGKVGQKVGSAVCRKNWNVQDYISVVPWAMGNAQYVDVILRSSPAAAAATIDTFEIWDGEITCPKVPVDRSIN